MYTQTHVYTLSDMTCMTYEGPIILIQTHF